MNNCPKCDVKGRLISLDGKDFFTYECTGILCEVDKYNHDKWVGIDGRHHG